MACAVYLAAAAAHQPSGRRYLRLIPPRRPPDYFGSGTARRLIMQGFPDASPWRKFNVRLTGLIIVAVLGGWAMSAVLASKPSTVGAGGPVEASAIISPMELMMSRGRNLPATDYVEPF